MEIKKETENEDHLEPLEKCRCCFKLFDDDENQLKITKMIVKRFMEITQIEVKTIETYSKQQMKSLILQSFQLKTSSMFPSTICELCNNELRHFSKFREEIITKQENFYSCYEEYLKDEFPNELKTVVTETVEELQFTITNFNDPLEPETQIEIKTELEDCVNDEMIMSQEILPEFSQVRTSKNNNLLDN